VKLTAKSDSVPNTSYLKMATLASKEQDNEPACFKKRSQFADGKKIIKYQRALFCTDVQISRLCACRYKQLGYVRAGTKN
jgi:hypothetical protein